MGVLIFCFFGGAPLNTLSGERFWQMRLHVGQIFTPGNIIMKACENRARVEVLQRGSTPTPLRVLMIAMVLIKSLWSLVCVLLEWFYRSDEQSGF